MNFRKFLYVSFFIVLITSLWPQNIDLLTIFSIVALVLMPMNKWWNTGSLSLLMFSFMYFSLSLLSGVSQIGFLSLSYLLAPLAFYRFGHYCMSDIKSDHSRCQFLLFIIVAYLLHFFIKTVVDIAVVGLVSVDRTLLGVDQAADSISATYYGSMAAVGIGSVGAIFRKELSSLNRFLFAIVVVFSLLSVIHIVNRGGLVILLVSLLVSLVIKYRSNKSRLILSLMMLSMFIVLLFQTGFISADILEAYQERNELDGYGVNTAGGRTDLWKVGFENLFVSPFGWSQESYAHNLWLDLAKIGGWLSLLPFLVVTVISIKNLLYLAKKGKSSMAYILVILNMALLIASSMEPVIESSMLFFSLLIFVWGMTDEVCAEEKRILS